MKKTVFLLLITAICISCMGKEENRTIDIQGTWYGNIDPHYVSKPENHITLSFDGNGKVNISTAFHSYTSGWYDSDGTYVIGSDGVITLNIQMTPSDLFEDDRNIPKITLTHATTHFSELDGDMLKLYFNKEYREDYFDEELSGKTTEHFIWLDRERPRY